MIASGEAFMTLELSEEIKTPRARNHLSVNEKERFWVVPLFLRAAAIFQIFNNLAANLKWPVRAWALKTNRSIEFGGTGELRLG